MRKSFAVLLVLVSAAAAFARGRSSGGSVHVRSHTTRTGSYVPAHERTAPDHVKGNNWSTKGNVNPTTGKDGTKRVY